MAVTTPLTVYNDWSVPTFYYAHGLSGLGATYADSDYPVANVLDRLENTYWLSTSYAGANDITYDHGSDGYTADYVGINGHNFYSADVVVSVQYSDALDLSTPGNSGTEAVAISAPSEDYTPLIAEFTSVTARWWRIRMTPSGSVLPKVVNMIWGQKTELDFASSVFDPTQSKYDSDIITSQTGVVLGIHNKQRDKKMRFMVSAADLATYDKALAWFDEVGVEPFFVTWNYPEPGFYMRNNTGAFSAPFVLPGGEYRNLNFDLIGRSSAWR